MNYFSISEAQAFRSQKANVQNCARAWNQEQSYLSAGACSLSDLTAETEVATSWCTKQQHGDCPWSHCWSSDLIPEDMPVSPVAQEQSGALVRSTVMSGWIHSRDSIAFLCPALHFMCLQLVWMLLWAEGDGIWGLEGLPCQVLQTSDTMTDGKRQQVSQDNFQSRLKC